MARRRKKKSGDQTPESDPPHPLVVLGVIAFVVALAWFAMNPGGSDSNVQMKPRVVEDDPAIIAAKKREADPGAAKRQWFNRRYIDAGVYKNNTQNSGLNETYENFWHPATPHILIKDKVIAVYDGDTLRTETGITVRFLGINTPEVAHPNRGQFHPDPFGDEAGAFLRNRVLNKEVTLIIPTSVPTGKYGRTLALVACDGVMLNALLLEEGLARHFFINNQELLNAPLWFEVETKARKTKRGIWSLLPDTRVSS